MMRLAAIMMNIERLSNMTDTVRPLIKQAKSSVLTLAAHMSLKKVWAEIEWLNLLRNVQKMCQTICGTNLETSHGQIWGHWIDIGGAKNSDIGKHFSMVGHDGGLDMKIHIVDFVHAHPKSPMGTALREKIEFHWIQCLHTQLPMGLNTMDKPPDNNDYYHHWSKFHFRDRTSN